MYSPFTRSQSGIKRINFADVTSLLVGTSDLLRFLDKNVISLCYIYFGVLFANERPFRAIDQSVLYMPTKQTIWQYVFSVKEVVVEQYSNESFVKLASCLAFCHPSNLFTQ